LSNLPVIPPLGVIVTDVTVNASISFSLHMLSPNDVSAKQNFKIGP